MKAESLIYLPANKQLILHLTEHPPADLLQRWENKPLDVEIKLHKEKRSLDANSFLWLLLQKIAEVLHTSKDEVYLQMLERYGQFTHLIVKKNAVDKLIEQWRICRVLGDVNIKGQQGTQVQCFFGSSTYDTAQFSILLNGVVDEAKELGIEVLPQEEVDSMLAQWNT